MAYDREPPTRRIPPTPPGEPPRETEYVDPALEEIRDRLRSLRTALALAALLATAALGVALYTLLSDEDREAGDGPRGASSTRVSQLDERVDELESEIDDRATKTAVSDLREDQRELQEQVEKASAQAAEGGGDEETQQAVEDLRGDVQALQQRVDEVAAQQDDGTP